MRKPKGNQCLCSACGQMFGGEQAFDLHRVGSFEPMERRCLTKEEIESRGKLMWNQKREQWQRPYAPISD
jgi:hypothetical protein